MPNTIANDFYTDAIHDLKLSEALEIYYRVHPQFTPWHQCRTSILKKMLKSHDISHVIYGCDTSMLGELRVQFWNTFGSNVPKNLKDFVAAMKDKDTRTLLTPTNLIPFFFTHLSEILIVRKHAQLMNKKWQFFKEEAYLDMPVGDIRNEFGIHPV